MLEFLLPAFVASLILTGIHAYLGVHVVERGVIFVDLALAQIAALGATVAIAGVLLVFCYLIVPSVGAMLFADRIGARLAIGWTMGTLVSALGVYLSAQIDLPTGATIVVTFGGVLIIMFLVHLLLHHGREARQLEGAAAAQREI